MSLFRKRLVKWREPKIRGMMTPKNVLAVFVLILIVSVPFGYWGGNGKLSVSICLLAFGFMSIATISFLIQPLLPGTLVQLQEDMIVRGARGTNSQKTAYKDIECINFYRDCSYSWNRNMLVVNIHQRNVEGPNFTSFVVVMKNDKMANGKREFSYASPRSIQQFAVPEDVNVEEVVRSFATKASRSLKDHYLLNLV